MTEIKQVNKMLNVWAFIVIVWSLYRAKFALPEWFDEFIAKPFIFIAPVYWYIQKYEIKSFFEQVGLARKTLSKDVKFAGFVGLLLTLAALAANYVKFGGFNFTGTLLQENPQALILVILLAIATAFSEEILSRGFVLKRLYEDNKNVYFSSFIASILFLVLHIPILFTKIGLSGPTILLLLATDFILSYINSLIYLDSKNLAAPILIHAFYNIAIILYI